MKLGDLVKVRYRDGVNELNDPLWTEPFHGIIFETPDTEFGMWAMWCIERGRPHILSPRKDNIEVVYEVNISDRHR